MKLSVAGEIRVPGDKSITHRTLMLAAAAEGESRLAGLLSGADCQSTAAVLRALGCEIPAIPEDGGELRIRGAGLQAWRAPQQWLDCGNSGTTARLLLGLLAGRPFATTLTGDDSLRRRPMRRVSEPLRAMGAEFREIETADRLPLETRGGALRPYAHRSAKSSAQVKSAVLLAGISGGVPVEVREPVQSRDHTERLLRSLGVNVRESSADDGWCVSLEPPVGSLPPLDVQVPGDFSSAAFFVALATLAGAGEISIRSVGVNPTRTGLLSVLTRMGADIRMVDTGAQGGEPMADLVVQPARLKGTSVGAPEIPSLIDEIPMLAVLAARAEGETTITGAAELRVKESDRIRAVVGNLREIGAEAEELPDGLIVRGAEKPLRGRVTSEGDHRIAMAFGVLGALPGNEIEVDDPAVVDVSFPGFWELLRAAAR